MRVITFSTKFPKGHPKAGQPTYFVEKIWESIYLNGNAGWDGFSDIAAIVPGLYSHGTHEAKHHTIRAGNRWKVGDKFSPRIWSDKPYRSKQIEFSPPLEIKKIWTFEMDQCGVYSIDGSYVLEEAANELLAKNDGLSQFDMYKWFMPNHNKPKEFKGQILCWNESIDYPIEMLQPLDLNEVV